ncbi:MAG TPA: DUF2442 domain-containing protein [Longimicrobium sp.]|nr:DUF2442 domain-containing protein [Longimicrobium sp.]
MFIRVDSVRPLEGYSLRLGFSDGTIRDIDLSGELYGEVFEPLKYPQFFRSVAVNPETGTIEWPNGADFAPEFLHEHGTPVHQVA